MGIWGTLWFSKPCKTGYSRHYFPHFKKVQNRGSERLTDSPKFWQCDCRGTGAEIWVFSSWAHSLLLLGPPLPLLALEVGTCFGSEKAPSDRGGHTKNLLRFLSRARCGLWGLLCIPGPGTQLETGLLSKRVLKWISHWCCKFSTPELLARGETIEQGGRIRDSAVPLAFFNNNNYYCYYSLTAYCVPATWKILHGLSQ